jgi:hypothetical protein
MKNKLTIIGKGDGWEDAPHEGVTWGITQLNLRRPVTRVIDMNDYSLWGEKEEKEAIESRALSLKSGIPYVDLDSYPFQEILDEFQTDYFSNTVDYAIALAIYEGFKEIDLYGVNMAVDTEYEFEKPGVDFWCGVAIGRGVKVTVHGNSSTIMKTRDGFLYGYGILQGVSLCK